MLKTGDNVSWVCTPSKGRNTKPFPCTGVIVSTKQAVFGGKLKKLGAAVSVSSKKWKALFPVRKGKTFVAADRLTLVEKK